MSGVKRSPANPFEDVGPDIEIDNSTYSLSQLVDYEKWLGIYLELDQEKHFRADERALAAKHEHLQFSYGTSYITTRDVGQLGILLGATVKEMETEFVGQTVLDIGSNRGRFGEAIARNAKADVTFVDTDEEALASIGKKAGRKVVADGKELPFEDESFEKTVVVFSSITWAETPVESAQALNEALRVTEPGGSVFLVPAFTRLYERVARCHILEEFERRGVKTDMPDERLAMKVWASQDHVVFGGLLRLMYNDRAEITWNGFLAKGQNTGIEVDNWSVIIDKNDSIPAGDLAANLAHGRDFMAA